MGDHIQLMIVDDQELMRDGLVTILNRQEGIEVVAIASDGREALTLALERRPDVILMDVRMPIMDGVLATREICQRLPHCRILMLTTFDDEDYIVGALQAGAVGYVLKNIPIEDLTEAVRMAHRGLFQLDTTAAAKIVEQLKPTGTSSEPDPAAVQQIAGLTDREREVMNLVAEGANNREIAEKLVISEGTVKTHISRILNQLNLRDRTQLAIFVVRHGLHS
ncbi:MAG: response regulator transcription factor [Ardenticatenaceae bacterium]|nr:response regulator transcription factor [Ardenticatenaceae bacterium]